MGKIRKGHGRDGMTTTLDFYLEKSREGYYFSERVAWSNHFFDKVRFVVKRVTCSQPDLPSFTKEGHIRIIIITPFIAGTFFQMDILKMLTSRLVLIVLCSLGIGGGVLTWGHSPSGQSGNTYGIGRAATQQEIEAWNIDINPQGKGLPSGKGSVQEGETVYLQYCAFCHGATGVEGPKNKLVGGAGLLHTNPPSKTIGSYWPYATTLYDYIFRAMPYTAPQSLTPNQVYAVVAWILYRNGILEETAVMDSQTLPRVRMPNRLGFVADPRPDVP